MKINNLSIKNRVTLYYALALILITAFIFAVLIGTGERQIQAVSQKTIMTAVQDSMEDIECRKGVIEINSDFDLYRKGVTLVIYGEEGNLIKGNVPGSFPAYAPLSEAGYHEISGKDNTWLIYDLKNSFENGQVLWVRGIYNMDNTLKTMRQILLVMVITIPLLIVLAVILGKRITAKAFRPIQEIAEGADEIGKSRDLSKRLPEGKHKDELYRLTETLNLMIARLERAFQAEKDFSSDVSHELKTPVSVILAECEYILQKDREQEEYIESIKNIQKKCRQSMSLISQLMELSRTINTDAIIEREEINLSVLGESVAEEMNIQGEKKKVRVLSDIAPDVYVTGDETLLMRLMINLLGNGIKYSRNVEDAYVKLTIKEGENILVLVEDNGAGIDEEDLPKIFNRFYKGDKARTGEEESFGLGLAMVKWIAEAHGGSVTAESRKEQGTRFTVELPR